VPAGISSLTFTAVGPRRASGALRSMWLTPVRVMVTAVSR
jgi:hypothetical protein